MSDWAASMWRAVTASSTQVNSHMSAAAQKDRGDAIQAVLDKQYEEQQRIIDETNRRGLAEQQRVYGQRQAVAYRLSIAQTIDARMQAREYELLSQDFLAKAQYKRGQMSVAYSRSGAMVGGAALLRLQQNRERAAEGSARLKRAATYARERGKMLSTITKHSAVKPSFVPIPDAIKRTHIEMPVPDANRGGGGGGRGGRGGSDINWALRTNTVVDDMGVRTGNPVTYAFQKGGVFQKDYPRFSGFHPDFGGAGDETWSSQPNWAAGGLTAAQKAMHP